MTSPPAPPASAPAVPIPTVTLALDPPRTVTFDYARLEAIEVGMNMSVLQVIKQLVPAMPEGHKPDQEISPAQAAELGAKLKMGFAARFVAACLGVTLEQLPALVPMPKLIGAFFQLSSGLAGALTLLETGGEEDAADPQKPGAGNAGSDPSAPGPASS